MEELYDLVNENNKLLGTTKAKSLVHKDGDWHRAVHVWVVNSQKQILLQKRSATKELSPNLWDLSMGGHISAGEDPVTAALRELQEELGMQVNREQLEYLFLSKEETILYNGIERLFHYIYLVRTNVALSQFRLQSSEVAEVKYSTVDDFEKSIKENKDQWMAHWEEYSRVIEILRKDL
jgi:isopentenyl-diphosphate delta-isomerase